MWGLTLDLFLRREGVSWYVRSKLYKGWSLCLNVFDFGGRSHHRPWQGSKNVLSTSPGQVDFLAWASNFKTHLNCPVGQASRACHPITKSLPKTSKKWLRASKIGEPWQSIVLYSSNLFLFCLILLLMLLFSGYVIWANPFFSIASPARISLSWIVVANLRIIRKQTILPCSLRYIKVSLYWSRFFSICFVITEVYRSLLFTQTTSPFLIGSKPPPGQKD